MRNPDSIVELRRLLRERLPQARFGLPEPRSTPVVPTGVPGLDGALGGGIPQGGLTELVGAGPGSGSTQVLHAMVRRAAADGRFVALVDGADTLDVDALEPDELARLLWVRCRDAAEALKATDLILRDRNFPLVVLDLKANPGIQLRKVSASVWHRFGRLLSHHGSALLVITPSTMTGASLARVRVASGLGLDALDAGPAASLDSLRFEVLRATEGAGTAGFAATGAA
jgi:hypothetical protein